MYAVVLCGLSFLTMNADPLSFRKDAERLSVAYPEYIKGVSEHALVWSDGSMMPFVVFPNEKKRSSPKKLAHPTLRDQIAGGSYRPGKPALLLTPSGDPGRIRYEPFFKKMYGDSPRAVERKLKNVDWLPAIFGKGRYKLRVTTVNTVDKKVALISQELEKLVRANPHYRIFLEKPAGGYYWRKVAHSNRISAHSFGICIDINATHTHYWRWDKQRSGKKGRKELLTFRNTLPWEIVSIFEKYGFIWAGKWYHYDTMHFEYRPELLL